MLDCLRHCDRALFLFINSHHNSFFDGVMWYISGIVIWIPLYLFIIFKVFQKYSRKIVWYIVLTFIVSVGLSNFISSEILKGTVCRLRPSHVPELQQYIHLVRNYTGGMYGFASSHSANMAAIAMLTSYFFPKKWIIASISAWALMIAYSRIYLGVHYPGDVVAGILIGITVSSGFLFLYRHICKDKVLIY